MQTLRGALIGFGFIAEHGHAPAYASGTSPLQIVAVAEPCVARHPAIRAALPGAHIYVDHGELLSREALDFVDVCTPPSEHMQVAVDALASGLHVLCEKPLAMTPAEAMLMGRAATRAERVLFPAHSYRHAPVIRSVRELLSHDAIGRVRMVTLDTYRTTHARGVAEWRPDWRREPRYAGSGILMDHGPHTSYLAFEWLGGYPTSVSAWSRSVAGDAVEDDATMMMVFPAGVARAHLSWNAGFRRVLYTLHGDRGAIRVEDDDIEIVQRSPDGAMRSEKRSLPSDWRDAGHGPWFEGVLRAFTTAIERRDWVGEEARDAIAGLEVISAALTSAGDAGRPATLPTRLGPLALRRSA
jgi:predicted dehydrogenase